MSSSSRSWGCGVRRGKWAGQWQRWSRKSGFMNREKGIKSADAGGRASNLQTGMDRIGLGYVEFGMGWIMWISWVMQICTWLFCF